MSSGQLDVVAVDGEPLKMPFALMCEKKVEMFDPLSGKAKVVPCHRTMVRISGSKDGHVVWKCRRNEEPHVLVTCSKLSHS